MVFAKPYNSMPHTQSDGAQNIKHKNTIYTILRSCASQAIAHLKASNQNYMKFEILIKTR